MRNLVAHSAVLFLILILAQRGWADPALCFNYDTTSRFTGETTTSSAGQVMVGQGDWTWLCNSTEVICLDTTDPFAPHTVGQLPYAGEPVDGLVTGHRLIVAYAENKLAMFDVSIPEQPVLVQSLSLPAAPLDLACRNDLLLVAAGTDGLLIYNISDLGFGALLHQFPVSYEAKGVCFTADAVALVAIYSGILEIDLTDPSDPVELATYNPTAQPSFEALYWDIEVVDDRVVALITDIMPVKAGNKDDNRSKDWDSPTTILLFDGLIPSEDHYSGYWARWSGDWDIPLRLGDTLGTWVVVYDENLVFGLDTSQSLASPSALTPSISLNAGAQVTSVAFSDSSLCIATAESTVLSMFSSEPVTLPAVATFASGQAVRFPGGPWAYSYTPSYGFYSDFTYYLWDLRQPGQPTAVDSTFCTHHPDFYHYLSIMTTRDDLLLEVEGDYHSTYWTLRDWSQTPASSADIYPVRDTAVFCDDLLVTIGNGALDVYDLQDPASPTLRSTLPVADNPLKVLALPGRILAYCNEPSGKTIYSIDLSDPDLPFVSSSIPITTSIAQFEAFGDLVVSRDWDGWLRVLNPVTLEVIGSLDSGDKITAMALAENVAWVGWGPDEMAAIDLSDPSQPNLLPGNVSVPGRIKSIALDAHLAYIACGPLGVHLVDTHDASAPVYIGGGSTVADEVFLLGPYPVIAHAVLYPDCLSLTPVRDQGPPTILAGRLSAAPNPFNGRTVLRLTANLPDGVHPVEIFDLTGRRVATLTVQISGGNGETQWYGTDDRGRVVSSGVYLVRVPGLGSMAAGRLVYLK